MTPARNASHRRSLDTMLDDWLVLLLLALDDSSFCLSFWKADSSVVFSALSGYWIRSHHCF